jgi:hypothetical protein
MIPLTVDEQTSTQGPPPVYASMEAPLIRSTQIAVVGFGALLVGLVAASMPLLVIGTLVTAGAAVGITIWNGARLRRMRSAFAVGRPRTPRSYG